MEKFTISTVKLEEINYEDFFAIRNSFTGHELYLVGGCVRDILLGRTPKDYDFCTDATPEEMLEMFEGNESFDVIPTGLKHGTITLHSKESNQSYEITTFRTDGDYADHRRPDEVKFTKSLEEDLKRRDLTINSMAIDVMDQLVNPDIYMLDKSYLYDLEYGIIRCVGDPKERFEEDALRMLRAIRFAAQLGFTLDTDTFYAIKEKASTIQFVSKERIRDELTKILMSDYPQMLYFLSLTGLNHHLGMPLTKMLNEPQHNKYHYEDVFHHTMDVINATKKDFETRWAALFHDWGKVITKTEDEEGWEHYYGHPDVSAEMAMSFMEEYKFDNTSKENIYKLVKYHDAPIGFQVSNKGMKKLTIKLGEHLVKKFLDLTFADRLAHRLENTDFSVRNIDSGKKKWITLAMKPEPMRIRDLMINGTDLLEIGLVGRQIGDTLNMLLGKVLGQPELNEREALLNIARQYKKDLDELAETLKEESKWNQ